MRTRHATQRRPECEVFARGLLIVHVVLLGTHTQDGPGLATLRSYVEIEHRDRPAVQSGLPRDHSHQGCLSRTVRAEQTQTGSGLNIEGEVIYRNEVTESLGYVAYGERW